MVLTVLLGVLLRVALVHRVGEWRTDERLHDAGCAAVEILPSVGLRSSQIEVLVEDLDLPAPAACLAVDRESTGVTEGSCADRPEQGPVRMGMLPPMLVLTTLWVATLVLLVGVAMGPERYVRKIVRNLRPDSAEPTKDGYALLFWRDVLLLLVVGSFAVARTADLWGPDDDELYEATATVVELVPDEQLDAGRLDSELRLLLGDAVTAEDVSDRFPEPAYDPEATERVERTYVEVRRLRWAERLDGHAEEGPPEDPAACVVVTRTTYLDIPGVPDYEPLDDSYISTYSSGRCEDEG